VPVPPLRGCPCTTTAICEHWQRHLRRKVFRSCDKVGQFRSCDKVGQHGNSTAEELLQPCCIKWTMWLTKRSAEDWCTQESLRVPSPEWLGIHGDAGALLSVGLWNELDYDAFEACLMNITFYGAAEVSSAWCTIALAGEMLLQ
jgi:hypothetical protein